MLLRRVIEHVKNQNWTAVTIDFVIVVVGVFIGIQVSNWNEDRHNDARTQGYYNRLINDFESERRALHARLNYMDVTEAYGEYALASLADPDRREPSEFLASLYQASQIWFYTVQRATYDELLSSGIAEAIPDPVLRTHLANVFLNAEQNRQVVVSTAPYRNNIRQHLPHDVQATVREQCGDKFLVSETSLVIIELPESCDVKFSDAQIENTLRALSEYPQLQRELVQRLANLDVTRGAIEAQIPLIDNMIAELQARLD